MDIKLKQRKFSLKVIVLALAVCLSILLNAGFSVKRNLVGNEKYTVRTANEINSICSSLKNLGLYKNNLNGDLKQDSVDFEVQSIINQIERYKNGEDYDISIDSKYFDMSEEEIKEAVIYNFKSYTAEQMQYIKRNPNIEFYYESQDGSERFTNTDAESLDSFENDTLDNYQDYIIINSDGNVDAKGKIKDITNDISDLNQYEGIYIRIAENLEAGDTVYEEVMSFEKSQEIGYVSLIVSLVDITAILLLIRSLLKRKDEVLKDDLIINILKKTFSEVKLIVLCVCVSISIELSMTECYLLDRGMRAAIISAIMYFILIEIISLRKVPNFRDEVFNKSVIKMGINYLKQKNVWIKFLFIIINIVILSNVFVISMMFTRESARISCAMSIGADFIIMGLIFGNLSSLKEISDGSRKISEGKYDCKIDVNGVKTFREIADNLENIQDGLKTAVDKAVKSEKMKGELITNVSHDLKTPLTSIISYVDLLSQENITEEQRTKYLNVLKDKSNRLKVLIEDLFEVSKASSGSVELHMINLDPVSLLRQTLGEFEDKIEESDLKIIKKFPEEKLIVYADGRKTFRVFQNLLSNIFKYSMNGSRVYIEVSEDQEFVEIIFKNTSREELNFTEEEILQRFKRGDASRSTEGSGLGLAIAKSLTEVQKGKFEIKIDGDLFKVIVRLRKGSNLDAVKGEMEEDKQ